MKKERLATNTDPLGKVKPSTDVVVNVLWKREVGAMKATLCTSAMTAWDEVLEERLTWRNGSLGMSAEATWLLPSTALISSRHLQQDTSWPIVTIIWLEYHEQCTIPHLSCTSWWSTRYRTTHFRVVEEVSVPAMKKSQMTLLRSATVKPSCLSSSTDVR